MPEKQISTAVALCGTDQRDVPGRTLRAGPITVEFSDGQLRYLRYANVEVLRGLAFLVRDENWGTWTPEIRDLTVRQGKRDFSVSYEALCRNASQRLTFSITIDGDSGGTLRFRGEAHAETDFTTARTGFVVLHPLTGTVGQRVQLEHVDGSTEAATFPELVDPVQPFLHLRAMQHEVMPGLSARVEMTGEAFETEDHRNWTDASFKTYVRPLAKPWPYVIGAGETVRQSVTVSFEGKPASGSARRGAQAAEIELGDDTGAAMPDIGLGVPAGEIAASLAQLDRVRLAAPRFLIGQIDSRKGDPASTLSGYAKLANACAAPMMLEIIATRLDGFEGELAALADAVGRAGLPLESIAVVPAGDLKAVLPGGERPPAPPLEALYRAARKAFPDIGLGGGMFSFFTELNRKRVPIERLDYVTNTTCPTVHAADDRSVMETLEALPHQVRTARSFIGDRPYRIGPTAIGCRDNPHGASVTPNPDNQRVCLAMNDPRMRGLFGAAWITGYIATLAHCGVASVSIGSTTGALGIIHRRMPYPTPFFDRAPAGAVYPSFHVLAGMTRASGSRIIASSSSDPARVQCIAYRQASGMLLWIANLTASAQRVQLKGIRRRGAHYGMLDESEFIRATTKPLAFQAVQNRLDSTTLELPPYATAFVGTAS